MPNYREKYSNYMTDARGNHVPCGSIFPVLSDEYEGAQDPHYAYKGYLYCDGRTLNIREYPQLYSIIRNTYGGSTQKTVTQAAAAGGIRRSYFINNKMFINFYKDPSINANVKRPYPYDAVLRFNSLGAFPSGLFTLNNFYGLKSPTENTSSFTTADDFAYEVAFPAGVNLSLINQANYTINFAIGSPAPTHPSIIVSKSYSIRDTPYQIGTFKLPDYRQRKIVGYGPVNGAGTSTVENAINNFVGQTGGTWYISKNTIVDSLEFFTVGDVKTTGYNNTIADISAYVTGSVKYTVGPVEDYTFPFPPAHSHRILSAEADAARIVQLGTDQVDRYAVTYLTSRANIIGFEPDGEAGAALGHSHGLLGTSLQSAAQATYGNVNGIGSKTNGNYDVSEGPTIIVSAMTYSSASGRITVNTSGDHGFDAGDVVSINGASPAQYSGNFTILANGLSSQSFQVLPTNGAPGTGSATGTITVKLANGYFLEQEVEQPPKAYVVDNDTLVGGKEQVFQIPGNAVTLKEEFLNSPGNRTVTLPDAGLGTIIGIEANIIAPGGGGADSDTDGTAGGYASFSIEVDGVLQTIYVYGGGGGRARSTGGAGGTVSIPQALVNDDRFQITVTTADAGDNGGAAGTGSSVIAGGGPQSPPGPGSGGSGIASEKIQNNTGGTTTYTSTGSWTIPAADANEVSRSINVSLSGGGGGRGNTNANSGCSPPAIGGNGSSGKRLSGTLRQTAGTLSWQIGAAGGQGFNNKDGNTGTGSEAGPSTGGSGAGGTRGGNGGTGAWGNGATAGAGGGVTGLFYDGTAIAGAAGGGGGGGSGGGFNGGGTTDGCYAGADGTSETVGLISTTNALDFDDGGNGSSSGCTSGGGGGGGGGCGTTNGSSGGTAGQAGVGHNGNGGGTGGARGASAYRSDYWSGAVSASDGAGQNSGGYVTIQFSNSVRYYDPSGGGGGQGGIVQISITGIIAPSYITLQSPGQGGGNAGDGQNGRVYIRYVGQTAGTELPGITTDPNGNYYSCATDGTPTGGKLEGDVWISSTDNNIIPVNGGTGSGNNGGFSVSGVPFLGAKVQRYIRFSGASTSSGGDRQLVVGTFNLTECNKIRFSVIRGSGQNGGDPPEEALNLFFRKSGQTSTTLFDSILLASNNVSGWQSVELTLPEGAQIRDAGVTLIISQDRPAGANDNATATLDNYGLAGITFFYDPILQNTFVSTGGATLPPNRAIDGSPVGNDVGIDEVRRTVTAVKASLTVTDGIFTMSSSTPIVTTAAVVPERDIPLITKYHRVKYLIKSY